MSLKCKYSWAFFFSVVMLWAALACAAGIKDYSTTASSNTALFPENMDPSDVNDNLRQVQADIRDFYEDPQWRDLGDTPTFVDTNTFTLVGDQTAFYIVGQRLRAIGSGAMGTIYGTISSSAFASVTTVDLTLDGSGMDATLTNVEVGFDPTNSPIASAGVSSGSVTEAVIAAGDYVNFTDVDDSNATKKDTVQGILDLAQDSTALTGATVATGDSFMFNDADDSDNPKTDTIQGILDLLDATLQGFASWSNGTNKIPYTTSTDTFGTLDFLDEDDFASDSATGIPSQQSTKAYIQTFANGALTSIDSGSLSGTDVDITSIPATYSSLLLYVEGASSNTATRALRVEATTDSTSLGDSTNSFIVWGLDGTTPVNTENANSLWTPVNQTAVQVSSAIIQFPDYRSGPIKRFNGMASLAAVAGTNWNFGGTGFTSFDGVFSSGLGTGDAKTGAITKIRIDWNGTGSFDAGTYVLYGVN